MEGRPTPQVGILHPLGTVRIHLHAFRTLQCSGHLLPASSESSRRHPAWRYPTLMTPASTLRHSKITSRLFEAHCQAGVTLQPDKCQLFRTSIEYLGHIISTKGIAPLPLHQETVKNWEFLTNVTQMRAFLAKTNYNRKFIQQYSSMAGILSETIKGSPKKNQLFIPTEKMEVAFSRTKASPLGSPHLRISPVLH